MLALLLTACGGGTTAPNSDRPILNRLDSLPKALATINLTATPNGEQIQSTVSRYPTATPAPVTLTPSPTAHLGVFIGKMTFPPGTIVMRGTGGRSYGLSTAFVVQPAATFSVFNPTVPVGTIGTLVPGSTRTCSVQPAPPFTGALQNPVVQQRLGCPTAQPFGLQLVAQSFQNGFMFWRDTKEIYVLSTAALKNNATVDTFWRYPDTWNATIPASDPSLTPPSGLQQPVRGFGYVWRSNQPIRASLGWALGGEQPYQASWQEFEHGWMMTGQNNVVFALAPSDGPPPTTGIHFGLLPQSGK